jgi:hypothetical protein
VAEEPGEVLTVAAQDFERRVRHLVHVRRARVVLSPWHWVPGDLHERADCCRMDPVEGHVDLSDQAASLQVRNPRLAPP